MSLTISPDQFQKAYQQLAEFVAINSVSNRGSLDYNPNTLKEAAVYISERLEECGCNVSTISYGTPDTPPVVLAELAAKTNATAKTIIIYGHYDVPPVEEGKWNTDPFTLTQKEGRYYGRGASDGKGGLIAITTALQTLKSFNKQPKYNLIILLEGQEEYGSLYTITLLRDQATRSHAAALIVFDGGNKDVNTGTLEISTRGVLTMHLEVKALQNPTPSGVGCLAPDPAQTLAKLIVSLENPRQIVGFMEDCTPPSQERLTSLALSSVTTEKYAKEHRLLSGVVLRGDPATSVYERIENEPSISIVNMTCGSPDGGYSIQDRAQCTIGIRLTSGQDPARIEEVVKRHLLRQPNPFKLPIDLYRKGLSAKAWSGQLGPISKEYLTALGQTFPKTATMPTGGTLPLFADFQKVFPEMEMLIVGIEDPDTCAHSHNESQSQIVFERAANAFLKFLTEESNS